MKKINKILTTFVVTTVSVILAVVIIFLSSFTCEPSKEELKEGDVLFQISKSRQAPFIQYATGSVWSHCGIVVEKNNQQYVLEASDRVKLTPLTKWINKGRFKSYLVDRVIDKPVKIKYSKYLGKPYDLSFKFNNGKYYCSELVYEIYKEQFGIKLGKPKKVKEYRLFGLKNVLKKRGINKNQLVIAPSDLWQEQIKLKHLCYNQDDKEMKPS